ncbi:unnamed protein product [Adineta steineri]|uniref:HTH psq-type domain-containing protein n=1 Tax=Adineta steineri TaxID=433720 RepID=A0A818KHD7_9BILA|nr:unnamed protein product [Adineta steineri]CAF3555248.1 unnamed protein product [Adineta steineri]
MSKCCLTRCQQDRKIIRREFSRWSKNILLQIALEAISKDYFQYDINTFTPANDEQIPTDFNPNESCLFCVNYQEYSSNNNINQDNTHFSFIENTSPLDLSLTSALNLNFPFWFDINPNILPIYQDDYLLTNHRNSNYFSQSFSNLNPFSSSPYQTTSLLDNYIAQFAKQMAYTRMLEEIECQRNNQKSNFFHSSSILTESMNVNHILHDIMIRVLHEIFEKQNNNDDNCLMKKQYQDNNQLNQSISSSCSSSSSSSSTSSTYLSSIHDKKKNKLQFKSTSTLSSRRSKNRLHNNKIIMDIDGKPIRPKRGQYRRYESEQLTKAVTAVLSNEMSVHRAGSYFGVPHSTVSL